MTRSVEVHIVPDTEVGFGRIGGMPPEGVEPSRPGRYFVSFALHDGTDDAASMFLHFDFDGMADARGIVGVHESEVSVVVHPPAPRTTTSEFASELSGHALVAGEEVDDMPEPEPDDDEFEPQPIGGHKLGGEPHLIRHKATTIDSLAAAKADGFEHCLQIDFPSRDDDDIRGDWPFGDGIMQIFRNGRQFRFLWDF